MTLSGHAVVSTRSKAGCITCRIRKIKCDESKPACTRCTSTGRKCDGYAASSETKQGRQRTSLVSKKARPPHIAIHAQTDARYFSNALTADECRWVLYFSRRTGPAISDLADGDFWSNLLPQLSVSEPAIRHALLAVSAVYAQIEAAAGTGQPASRITREFSIRHYNQAIVCLRQHLNQESATAEAPLICCLLFICLECLFENRPLVLEHLQSGINILNSDRFRGTGPNLGMVVKRKLEQILPRLDAQLTLFGNPVSTRIASLDDVAPETSAMAFSSVEDAGTAFNRLVVACLNAVKSLSEGTFANIFPGFSVHAVHQRLQEQLLAWRNGLNNLEGPFATHASTAKLRVQHSACFVYLSTCLEAHEACYDAYISEFTTIVRLVDQLLGTTASSSELSRLPSSESTAASLVFSLDASIIPPLFLTAMKCRDPALRREAIRYLETTSAREGVWIAKLHARVAQRAMEIEEGMPIPGEAAVWVPSDPAVYTGLPTATGQIPLVLPTHERIWVRHYDIMESPQPRCARVIFRTLSDDIPQRGNIWQEYISY